MDSYGLLLEVRRLKALKQKNEESVPMDELQTRYKKSYDKLCENLKEKQCQLRVSYMSAVNALVAVMSESVYIEPEAEDGWLFDTQREWYEKSGRDLLVKELFNAFWYFGDPQDENKN